MSYKIFYENISLPVKPNLDSLFIGNPIYIDDISINTVGVWDTVGAMGIPIIYTDENEHGTQERSDLFRFADNNLSSKVCNGFHAIACDERRVDYTPTLWNDRNRIEQVFFAGAHADVGGGYSKLCFS